MALTPKQQRFVQEYLIDLNATQAAIRANYSARMAHKIGPELLGKTSIQEAIAAATLARSKRTKVAADRVVRELARLAFSDIGNIIDFTGDHFTLRPPRTIPASARRAIASIKVKKTREGHGDNAVDVELIEFKLWDKPGSLEKLARHLGMYQEKVPLEVLLDSLGELGDAVREHLANHVPSGPAPEGDEQDNAEAPGP